MPYSFHRDPDIGASANSIVVFADGDLASRQQIDQVLMALNTPALNATITDAANAFAKPETQTKTSLFDELGGIVDAVETIGKDVPAIVAEDKG